MMFSARAKVLNDLAAQAEYVAALQKGVTFTQHGRQGGGGHEVCWHWLLPRDMIEPVTRAKLPQADHYLWSMLILGGMPFGSRIVPLSAAMDWTKAASQANAAPFKEFTIQ